MVRENMDEVDMIGENSDTEKAAGGNAATPTHIKVRGARGHNLKNINVDIPLNKIVGIAGVSGSGKSSLALGILYAEGSRRYLEALSTYTRRRMTQAEKAQVDEVLYVPAALALRQRPGVPGIRSTFGTGTELLNNLRLMYSRLGEHRCPNGHYLKPSLNVAAELPLVCPVCGETFFAPGAEELAFNSQGGCKRCDGTGIVRIVDESTLVPDESLTIDEGAVAPWQTLMWSLMKDIAREMGVRTNVPFKDLTEKERDIVFHGPAVKKNIIYQNRTSGAAGDMDFTYFNATYTVDNALSKVKDEKGMKRVEKFLRQDICPDCGGTRLSDAARAPRLRGISLAQACQMTLSQLVEWVDGVPGSLPEEMRPMARSICESFQGAAKRLADLGLSYLTLDRSASTLSTGERQRMQLARAVRNRTTGVLYVLDEPSIGLHPSNMEGLTGVMHDLLSDGNTVILVDHDTNVLKEADWLIELGPEAGAGGGRILAQGPRADVEKNPDSRIAGFLTGSTIIDTGKHAGEDELFRFGRIHLETGSIHTVKPLQVDFPKGRLTAVTGVSGSGKTTLILESLIPALEGWIVAAKSKNAGGEGQESRTSAMEGRIIDAESKDAGGQALEDRISSSENLIGAAELKDTAGEDRESSKKKSLRLPPHIREIQADGIRHVKLIDATPIGINVRSTVATYADIHDELRKVYAKTPQAKAKGYKAGDFSYNTGRLRCPVCDGTGTINLDVQFLPDVEIPCPDCGGSRYGKEAGLIRRIQKAGKTSKPDKEDQKAQEERELQAGLSLPELMDLSIDEALAACQDLPAVTRKLQVLHDLGLGYLTLGEETPSLSGGEAQRLKLASEMGKVQSDSVFVFDEPTIGLHPLDVQTLLSVFMRLIESGATVIVIEHDLDVIRNADYVIDLGPGGGEAGGRIIACGTPQQIRENPDSVTGRYLD